MRPACLLLLLFLLSNCSRELSYEDTPERKSKTDALVPLARLGGSGEDRVMDMALDASGVLQLAGYSNSSDGDLAGKATEGNDYWLLSLDADGHRIRSKSYGGSLDDKGQAIAILPGGAVAMAGYAMSADGDASQNQGSHDNWILKLNAAGGITWERSFGFSGHDHAYDIAPAVDGGFFVAGFLDVTASGGAGNKKDQGRTAHGVGEFWVNRLDAQGNLMWRRYYGGSNNDRAYAICSSPDGGAVLAGFTESDDFDISASSGSYDFWVLKINAVGDLVWERTFGGSGIDIAYDLEALPGGGYLVAGQSISRDGDRSDARGGSDAWLIKISEQGVLLWEKSYGTEGFDLVYDVAPAGETGFLLCGSSRNLEENTGSSNFWAFEVDATGELQWEQHYQGTGINELRAGVQLPDGRKLFAGSAQVGEQSDGILFEYDDGIKFRR